jgi:hypothetical protein
MVVVAAAVLLLPARPPFAVRGGIRLVGFAILVVIVVFVIVVADVVPLEGVSECEAPMPRDPGVGGGGRGAARSLRRPHRGGRRGRGGCGGRSFHYFDLSSFGLLRSEKRIPENHGGG